jgi:Protein of unknown function (DUF938)
MTLKLPDTGAPTDPQGRRHSPSAQRNAPAIRTALQAFPVHGNLLEIASGSGYHAAQIAPHFPNLTWQPTEFDAENLPSITAWTQNIPNIRPPIQLDATTKGWHKLHPNQDAILLINLLHLISSDQAVSLLNESVLALTPGGHGFFYGPFLRDGQTTSQGDASFHASLQLQNPEIGYKDLAWTMAQLSAQNLQLTTQDLPTNNILLIAHKPR